MNLSRREFVAGIGAGLVGPFVSRFASATALTDLGSVLDGTHLGRFSFEDHEVWSFQGKAKGIIRAYFPVAPHIKNQPNVETVTKVNFGATHDVIEDSDGRKWHRYQSEIDVDDGDHPFEMHGTYTGDLYRYELKPSSAPTECHLTEYEQSKYLQPRAQSNFEDAKVVHYIRTNRLQKAKREDPMDFARRVFNTLVSQGTYQTNPDPDRSAPTVCQTLTTDCGGFAFLFCAVLRASGIPARPRVGRWAIEDPSGNYHVTAEFYVMNVGWIPVDVSSQLGSKREGYFFGRDPGPMFYYHVDSDLILDEDHPSYGMPWVQNWSVWYDGEGFHDFKKNSTEWKSKI